MNYFSCLSIMLYMYYYTNTIIMIELPKTRHTPAKAAGKWWPLSSLVSSQTVS